MSSKCPIRMSYITDDSKKVDVDVYQFFIQSEQLTAICWFPESKEWRNVLLERLVPFERLVPCRRAILNE